MRARIDGAWREIAGGRVRIGGAWKNLVRVSVYVGGAWKDAEVFLQPLALSASPTSVGADISGGGTATTNATTVTPSGGQAPYTYAWVESGGEGGVVISPTSATTQFRKLMLPNDVSLNQFTCTVTDSLGATAQATVSAIFDSFP